jgi:hypothetical protein
MSSVRRFSERTFRFFAADIVDSLHQPPAYMSAVVLACEMRVPIAKLSP